MGSWPTASTGSTSSARRVDFIGTKLEAFPDERLIWSRPAGLPNSAGTLTLHLAGNLRHFIGAVLGGDGYVRDREHEFSAAGISRHELIERIGAAETAIKDVLPRLTEARLAETFPVPILDHSIETGELLLQLSVHLAYHLGQVSYHRRMVTGDPRGVGALSAAELSTARPTLPPSD